MYAGEYTMACDRSFFEQTKFSICEAPAKFAVVVQEMFIHQWRIEFWRGPEARILPQLIVFD